MGIPWTVFALIILLAAIVAGCVYVAMSEDPDRRSMEDFETWKDALR